MLSTAPAMAVDDILRRTFGLKPDCATHTAALPDFRLSHRRLFSPARNDGIDRTNVPEIFLSDIDRSLPVFDVCQDYSGRHHIMKTRSGQFKGGLDDLDALSSLSRDIADTDGFAIRPDRHGTSRIYQVAAHARIAAGKMRDSVIKLVTTFQIS